MATEPQDRKSKTYTATVGGKEFVLQNPKAGWLRKNRKLDAVDLMFTAFEEFGSEEFLAAVDALDLTEADELFGKWIGSMGSGDAGKSGGSSK